MTLFRITVLVCAPIGLLLTALDGVSDAPIAVAAGGDHQIPLVNAQPGDTITLRPGAIDVGNFTLPTHASASYITLETAKAGVPEEGARIAPGQALAGRRSPDSAPALHRRGARPIVRPRPSLPTSAFPEPG